MADFLNYGNQRISSQDFINDTSNNVVGYVQNQPWTKKKKDLFMTTYRDLMSKGILGASNETGEWLLDVAQDPQISSKSKSEQEMYGVVAQYMLDRMKKLPTQESLEEQEKKRIEALPLYTNDIHSKNIHNLLSSEYFGGNDFSQSQDWDELDKRDKNTGKRAFTERALRLKSVLEKYRDSFKGDEYKYETGPFASADDVKSRLNDAISALNNPEWNEDDINSLNRLGLNWRDYFNNGLNDIYGVDEKGNKITYEQYYQGLQDAQRLELEQKRNEELARKKAKLQEDEKNKIYFTKGNASILGQNLNSLANKYKTSGQLIQAMNELSQRGFANLSPEEMSELTGAFRYGKRQPISDDLFNRIQIKYRNRFNKNDFEIIPGIENAVWYKPTQSVWTFSNSYNNSINNNEDWLQGYSDEAKDLLKKAAAKNRVIFSVLRDPNNARYKDPDGSINWTNMLKDTGVDNFRLHAILDDIGALVASFFPGYGTAISAGLSIDGMLKEAIADIADESVSWSEVATNLGSNAIWTAIGLIPGGKIPKIGKYLGKIGKIALPLTGAVMGTVSGAKLLSDPEVKKSWEKVLDGNFSDVSGGDLRNILLVLTSAVGIAQGARGTANAIKYGRFTPKTQTIQKVKTNKGDVEVNPEQLAKLRKASPAEANRILNEEIKKGTGYELDTRWWAKGPLNSKKVKIITEERPGTLSAKQKNELDKLRIRSERQHAGEGIYKYVPRQIREYMPTTYDLWHGNWRTPFVRINNQETSEIKPIINPNLKLLPNNTVKPIINQNLKSLPNKTFGASEVTPYRSNTNLRINNQEHLISNSTREIQSYQNNYHYTNNGNPSGNPSGRQITGNYMSDRNPISGNLEFEFNGKKIKFNLSKKEADKLKNNPGLISQFRNKNSKQIDQMLKDAESKKLSTIEIGKILRNLKQKGWLKQGGKIEDKIYNLLKD